jgi:hypothetical protein
MNLVTTNTLDQLPLSLKSFAEARVGSKCISDLDQSVIKGKCLEIIARAYSDLGQSVEPDILSHQRNFLAQELSNKRFGILTLPEVQEAFKMGIRGESGPYFGMCPKTYYQFLKYYLERPERVKAMDEYLKLVGKVAEKPKVSPEEADKILINYACQYFEDYKSTGKLEGMAFRCSEAIKRKLGLRQFVTDKKTQELIKDEAAREYSERLEASIKEYKYKGNFTEAQKIANLLALGFEDNRSYKNLVSQHALKYFFDSLIREGKSLKELINP